MIKTMWTRWKNFTCSRLQRRYKMNYHSFHSHLSQNYHNLNKEMLRTNHYNYPIQFGFSVESIITEKIDILLLYEYSSEVSTD